MIFRETALRGAFLIEPEKIGDERGFFARTWCRREFAERGIPAEFVQGNLSYNARKGTLRGMHYQEQPYGEAKLICCSRGAVYDVIIDLRSGSETFGQWVAQELSAVTKTMLFIPDGFAHGFLTLSDEAEIIYQMSQFYTPGYARGIRWNDPAFGISWPGDVAIISEKDMSYPDFKKPVRTEKNKIGGDNRPEKENR